MLDTTETSEKSFSTLKRLKTYLRNTTGENRLNSLALLNIHREIVLTIRMKFLMTLPKT